MAVYVGVVAVIVVDVDVNVDVNVLIVVIVIVIDFIVVEDSACYRASRKLGLGVRVRVGVRMVVVMLEARLVDVVPATALQSEYRNEKRPWLASHGLVPGCLSRRVYACVCDHNLSSPPSFSPSFMSRTHHRNHIHDVEINWREKKPIKKTIRYRESGEKRERLLE